MEDRSTKILKGCGIGCAVIAGLIIFLIALAFFKVKEKITEFKELESSAEVLEKKFGDINDFTPYISQEEFNKSIEKFIRIRENSRNSYDKLSADLLLLEDEIESGGDKSIWDALDIISSGLGILPSLLEFYQERNDEMIKNEVGLGEYYHNYILVYYSYLRKYPGDGPKFSISNDITVKYKSDDEDKFEFGDNVMVDREYKIKKLSNKYFRAFYRNLIEKKLRRGDDLYDQIIEELNKLKEDKYRIPWQDEVPDFVNNMLEDRRDKLEALYYSSINPIELNPFNK